MKTNMTRFIRSEKAVSETVGYILLVGVILLGVSILLVIAYPIQSDLQDTASMETQILALTALDGRVSTVAFGSSPSQVTKVDLGGGSMQAQNTTDNRLTITVSNQSGYQVEIFNRSLGLIEYTLNENKIAFENGGLFRMYPSGDTLMLSPPEFYSNGETLTFPILRVNSTGWMGGKGVINVRASSTVTPNKIYPNLSTTFLVNPIYGKKIKMRLKSDYYQAWGRYIEERTEAVPLTNDITKEVIVSFNSKPSDQFGSLTIPIEVMGVDVTDETPLNQFAFNLSDVDSDYHMVLRAPSATSNDLVIEMQKSGGMGTAGMTIVVSYNKGGYNETWKSETLGIITANITSVNMLNASANATYESNDLSGTWINETSPYNKVFKKTGPNGPVPLDIILQHYIRLASDTGTFAIYPGTKSGDPAYPKGFNATGSTYVLDYDIMPPTINYLHIIDHEVDVSFS
jgi:hypothetical protein